MCSFRNCRQTQRHLCALLQLGAAGALLMLGTACLQPANVPSPAPRLLANTGASVNTLRSRLPQLMDSGGIPGASVAIISGGKVNWAGGFGVRRTSTQDRVDAQTVFEAASLSKPVLAFAALRLVDEGRLDLDRPLASYLPLTELSDPRGAAITARHVLSHTTGLQNERIGADTLSLAFSPGEKFHYSGEAYTYLGTVIAGIVGASLDDAMRQLVFQPLGMTRSAYVWDATVEPNVAFGHGEFGEARTPARPKEGRAAATLHTTAHDYARFVVATLDQGRFSPGTRALMLGPQVDVAPGVQWTLGWSLAQEHGGTAVWHHGDNSRSGFTAFVMADPGARNGFVYFANSTTGLGIIHELLSALGGGRVAADWINRERYDSPARIVRLQLERETARSGGESAMQLYARLKETYPAGAFGENLLNGLGYRFLQLGRPADAVILFQRNAEEYPESANVFDSLGDGLAAAGDRDAAIRAYERSFRLDPTNSHAAETIEQLRRTK